MELAQIVSAGHAQPNGNSPPAKRRRTNSSPVDPKLPLSRRRTACQSCRIRKVKCDQLSPCRFCKSSGTECVYANNASENLLLNPATRYLAQRLDQIIQTIDGISAAVTRKGSTAVPRHASFQSHLSQGSQPDPCLEPSRDYLQIPPHRTTADTVLTWPIFGDQNQPNSLIEPLFSTEGPRQYLNTGDGSLDENIARDLVVVPGGLISLPDEKIPGLIDSFLQNVHTKNPILDVEYLVRHGRKAAENGLGWDAPSCLVLLACALGSVARPFEESLKATDFTSMSNPLPRRLGNDFVSSVVAFRQDLQHAESCYVLACRRLGLLKFTPLSAQCHFFAGVYQMYTLRPIAAWNHFTQASTTYQLYLKRTCGPNLGDDSCPNLEYLDRKSKIERRIDQSLYWSCFKSECEFRVELPLPQSEIAQFEYPHLFPSPPSPVSDTNGQVPLPLVSPNPVVVGIGSGFSPSHLTAEITPLGGEVKNIQEHSKCLCKEEESWYYYLTEIALRRIGNRIINTFYRQDPHTWMDVKPLIPIAREFEAQVSVWSQNLPSAMQQYETSSTIRAPRFDSATDGSDNSVSKELSWATENRLLEMRSWLYQPFLYYAIHYGHMASHEEEDLVNGQTPGGRSSNIYDVLNERTSSLHPQDADILHSLIVSGIECNLQILDARSLHHRHHGLWFDLRSLMTASFILLALIKSNNTKLIPGGPEVLFGLNFRENYLLEQVQAGPGYSEPGPLVIGGKLSKVFRAFSFWEEETPDLKKSRGILEKMVREVITGLIAE